MRPTGSSAMASPAPLTSRMKVSVTVAAVCPPGARFSHPFRDEAVKRGAIRFSCTPMATIPRKSRQYGGLVEALDAVGAVLPVLVDGDEQLEVGAGRELLAHPRTGLLQHGAALADHHALLAVALDEDLDADAGPLPFGHLRGDGVRQLV